MRSVAAGLTYGIGAFGIGFLFGALREFVLIPQLGQRTGHLAEFHLVIGGVVALGLWLGLRLAAPRSRMRLLATGLLGVALLVFVESSFAVGVLGLSWGDYLAAYDLTKGALFPIGLALMTIAPLLSRFIRH
ncbi:MAG: hypothetical protein AAGD23_08835 [Pseudomonadota bacterium]